MSFAAAARVASRRAQRRLNSNADRKAARAALRARPYKQVIEPWGGGKWHLEVFRSGAAEPEEWNGEL